MKNLKKFGMVSLVVAVCGVAVMAVQTTFAARPPRECICLDIYRPVICPNGLIYPNDCYARCDGQRNCVLWGGDTE